MGASSCQVVAVGGCQPNIQGTIGLCGEEATQVAMKDTESVASPCAAKAAHCMYFLVTHDMWALPIVCPSRADVWKRVLFASDGACRAFQFQRQKVCSSPFRLTGLVVVARASARGGSRFLFSG